MHLAKHTWYLWKLSSIFNPSPFNSTAPNAQICTSKDSKKHLCAHIPEHFTMSLEPIEEMMDSRSLPSHASDEACAMV